MLDDIGVLSTSTVIKATKDDSKIYYLIINFLDGYPVNVFCSKLKDSDLDILIQDFYIKCCKDNAVPMILAFNNFREREDTYVYTYDEYKIIYSSFSKDNSQKPRYSYLHTNWGTIESDTYTYTNDYFPTYLNDRPYPYLVDSFLEKKLNNNKF